MQRRDLTRHDCLVVLLSEIHLAVQTQLRRNGSPYALLSPATLPETKQKGHA